ncbi:MAG TPA: GAF domain-containing SpoIIE family protein phosphatase [Gaiellaceae bacterium]|nr:GAF domain-containing SpoIIE family protein phosphatase [Gaiellaceae bacterium]
MTLLEARRQPLRALAEAAAGAAGGGDLRGALATLADATLEATQADLVVLRLRSADGDLPARAVAPATSALAAEVAGSRATLEELEAGEAPAPTRRAAEAIRASGVHVEAARVEGRIVGSVELVRVAAPFDDDDRAAAALVAAQIALATRALGDGAALPASRQARRLELAGEALAAGGDTRRAAQQAVRTAADTTGANAGAVWRLLPEGGLELLAGCGDLDRAQERGRALVLEAAGDRRQARPACVAGLPESLSQVLTLPLGEPPFAALQLFHPAGSTAVERHLPSLTSFAARVAHALRACDRASALGLELGRTRSLLEVLGEAISHLSLAHTLETAVGRVAELLQIEQLGVYLLESGALRPAAGRGLGAGHEEVARRLFRLMLGPLRARPTLFAQVAGSDPALAPVREALRASGRRAVVGAPLQTSDEPIGLLVAYPAARTPTEGDRALLAALAAQLAVAVQNARLHEQAKELGQTLTDVLASERQSTRRLTALYEISRSFAQSLSLDATLDAVTSTIVEVLNVDAAVIRVPDERGDQFVPAAVHVTESRLAAPVRTILDRPQPRPPRTPRPLLLDAAAARRMGGAHALLVPFLEKGSTAALLPIESPTELLAQLTILSLDPAAPIDGETLATAQTISQQAALAIDNARLYQQQKRFAETMQQSLLPRERPAVPGLEVGAVYESAARVDVGGDVFDFLELADGRLAVVLGDVTGHGIDATADMAMAKFVFRSLARDHPDPADFLAHANDVVLGEIAVGKFITMASVLVDPGGEVRCASAGHPEPRLVLPDGAVQPLSCGGLALGIEASQRYEPARAELPPGGAVVLYTDGVVEARRGAELFGVERLDGVLADRRAVDAQTLAKSVLEACRLFGGGELQDDCAVVVIRRR